jgi:bacteriocin biosynthesis cyclodehydratase domain-containing protein
VVTDAASVVGPFVEPGDGPCLRCLELHRRDADPSWPAIATQLLGRRSAAQSAVLVAETAAAVGRLVMARLTVGAGDAASTRIDAATGERTVQHWGVHEECGCRGVDALLTPLSRARPETGWAGAAPRARSTRQTS